MREALVAAFKPDAAELVALTSRAVGLVVIASCVIGPLAAAAQGIAYSTRRFGAVAAINWAGLAAFVPALAVASRYAPGSLAATRAAFLVPSAVGLVGCLVLVRREGADARISKLWKTSKFAHIN